jgi:hypothetical protein
MVIFGNTIIIALRLRQKKELRQRFSLLLTLADVTATDSLNESIRWLSFALSMLINIGHETETVRTRLTRRLSTGTNTRGHSSIG